jgi:hypothetical protein
MRHLSTVLFSAACLLPFGGCDSLSLPILTDQVRVVLVNDGDYDVNVVLYYDNEQGISESNLRDHGTRLEYTVADGDSVSFLRNCADLQAIMIDEARLQVLGDLGPQTSTDVLRDGDDFDCRETITFTFDHSGLLLDFGVTVDVSQ